MSPILKALALEALALDLAGHLRDAEDDPTAIDRIGDTVTRILYANHPELVAHEKAHQS